MLTGVGNDPHADPHAASSEPGGSEAEANEMSGAVVEIEAASFIESSEARQATEAVKR
ncbi:hypothetical protein ACOCG7_28270 [Paraburkholderia sp. DD10]|uniref:hypothetical protein n=1 Tax=Paraburkholderia TaxID=1822464 RepID=UPI001D0C6E20|nr:hypothetical protein [Paraburkholderia terricola]MDR6495798.1 hypothetical protein [Paraburkholderia terricola]